MRKLFPLAILFIFIFIVTSCKKRDYVCTCVENHGGTYQTVNYPLGNVNDNTAEAECNGRQVLLSNNGTAASCKTNF